ncbi:radical SAM protein [Streptomyces sp. KR80]|uniref:radical SAM protein n=1 Tax=Streptomyces sp. KR80 TaxID=3457426 RepID=UPI003FD43946
MVQVTDGATRYARRIAARPQTLVLQPTSFCNLDCRYCYLPARDQKNHMTVEVASAVAHSAADLIDAKAGQPLGVVWHAGEPLALGIRRFTELVAPFEQLRKARLLRHYVQTNATLLTDAWCDILSAYGFRVGVSIDGPATLATQRVDRHGRSAFARIMKGIQRLRERNIAFSVIAVVSQQSIDQPEALLDFFADLGCDTVGLNIEETEGINTNRQPPSRDQAIEFWQHAIAWKRRHPGGPAIRELDRLGDYLRTVRSGHRDQWDARRLDPIPTISAAGEVGCSRPSWPAPPTRPTTTSGPETYASSPSPPCWSARIDCATYGNSSPAWTSARPPASSSTSAGERRQANRYFENGSLATTETNYCRVSQQALVMALSDTVRKEAAA